MPHFDVIFFDIGSTLIPSAEIIHAAAQEACQSLAQSNQIPHGPEFLQHYLAAEASVNPPHLSHIYSDERLIAAAERFAGLPASAERRAVFLTAFRKSMRAQIRLVDEPLALFRALAQAGIQRGIISEGSAEGQGEVLNNLRLLPFISPGLLFISENEGCTKADPVIYRRAVAASGVPAQRTLMIGDRMDLDVAVPQSVGMRAALFKAYAAPAFVPSGLEEEYRGVQPDFIFGSWGELESGLKKIL